MNGEITFAGIVLLLNLLTELAKKVIPQNFNRYIPVAVEVFGFVFGLLAGFNWFESLFVGLSAMGLYRGTKVVVRDV
jgi:hypothetical protein